MSRLGPACCHRHPINEAHISSMLIISKSYMVDNYHISALLTLLEYVPENLEGSCAKYFISIFQLRRISYINQTHLFGSFIYNLQSIRVFHHFIVSTFFFFYLFYLNKKNSKLIKSSGPITCLHCRCHIFVGNPQIFSRLYFIQFSAPAQT